MVVLLTAAAACGGGGGGDTDDDIDAGAPTSAAGPTTTAGRAPTTVAGTTVPAATLTLKIADVRLINSEESDSGMRVLLPAGVASASVTLTGVPTPNRVVSVCQANDLDRRLSTAACRTPANGEAVTVNLGSVATGVEIIQVGVSGAGAEGNSTNLSDVTIRYAASSREMSIRLPQIAGSDAAGGRPTFGLTPASTNGAYRAQLNWTIIPVFGGTDNRGRLEVVQGANVVNQANSTATEAKLEGTLSPPGEAAIRIQNVGTAAMVTPKLILLLP
ncbi:MAG TPA: hypothetical protein VJ653_02385 [Acidimicrobiales bacterium]|nr:hypothetical protein [Acidimicrobiales bacterium]